MSVFYNIIQVPLTSEEKKKLSFTIMLIPAVFGLIGVFAFYFIVIQMSSPTVGIYILLGIGSLFVFIMAKTFRANYLDAKSGVKQVLRGVITRKIDSESETKPKDRSTMRAYYLYFNDYELIVEKEHFDACQEGDMFEFQFAEHTKLIFSYQKLMENTLDELMVIGVELHDPKPENKLSLVTSLLLIAVLMLVTTTGIFWVNADCVYCENEYQKTIAQWQNKDTLIKGQDQLSKDANAILMLLNDTLKDDEERQIAMIFRKNMGQSKLGELIDKLDSIYPQHDRYTGLMWVKRKYNEQAIIDKVTVPELWMKALYFVSRYEGFKETILNEVNDHQIEELDAYLFLDRTLTLAHYEKWFANTNSRDLQYAMYAYLKDYTSNYSPAANQFLRSTFENGEQLPYKNSYMKERAEKVYGK